MCAYRPPFGGTFGGPHEVEPHEVALRFPGMPARDQAVIDLFTSLRKLADSEVEAQDESRDTSEDLQEENSGPTLSESL
jgi:hypothetical protein